MDRFVTLLEQLFRPPFRTSDHCRHAIVRLSRRVRHGTRGQLELKWLLEDLLESLPPAPDADATAVDLLENIRSQGKLFLSIQIPMRAPPVKALKRPASPVTADDRNGSKRAKQTQQALEDAQLLFNYLHPLPGESARSSRSSVSSLLGNAWTGDVASMEMPELPTDVDLELLWSRARELIPFQRFQEQLNQLDRMITMLSRHVEQQRAWDVLELLVDILSDICAPARDAFVATLRKQLASIRETISLQGDAHAGAVQDKLQRLQRDILQLVELMHQDLKAVKRTLAVASSSETDVRRAMREEAMQRERAAIFDLFGRNQVQSQTLAWIARMTGATVSTLTRPTVRPALVKALFMPHPVSVPTTGQTASLNALPPILCISARHLFYCQNRIQALTILATLATLVPVPSPSDWADRVWVLLSEDLGRPIEQGEFITVAHIADEIVRAASHGRPRGLPPAEEAKLRKSVDRMLKLDDPVYKLLSARLEKELSRCLALEANPDPIRGFSVSPLPGAVKDTAGFLRECLVWCFECWSSQMSGDS